METLGDHCPASFCFPFGEIVSNTLCGGGVVALGRSSSSSAAFDSLNPNVTKRAGSRHISSRPSPCCFANVSSIRYRALWSDRQQPFGYPLTEGFTGKLAAKYVAQNCPTDLSWAVSGRSHAKLTSLVNEVRAINTNRRSPGVIVADSNDLDALAVLARSTKVVVSFAGPFALYFSIR